MTELTQRELRNKSGEIMLALDRGGVYAATRCGWTKGARHSGLRSAHRGHHADQRALFSRNAADVGHVSTLLEVVDVPSY